MADQVRRVLELEMTVAVVADLLRILDVRERGRDDATQRGRVRNALASSSRSRLSSKIEGLREGGCVGEGVSPAMSAFDLADL